MFINTIIGTVMTEATARTMISLHGGEPNAYITRFSNEGNIRGIYASRLAQSITKIKLFFFQSSPSICHLSVSVAVIQVAGHYTVSGSKNDRRIGAIRNTSTRPVNGAYRS